MKQFLVKIIFHLARKIDFNTLQRITMDYFDKTEPESAVKVYSWRLSCLKFNLMENDELN